MISPIKVLFIVIIGILATSILTNASPSPTNDDWDMAARQRKADYVYVTACGANAMDSSYLSYRLAEYASALDPDNVTIATFAASHKLFFTDRESEDYKNICRLIIDQFYADPSDYENGLYAAQAALALSDLNANTHIWQMLDSLNPTRTEPAPNLASAYLYQYIAGDTAAYGKAMSIYNRLERGTGKDIGLTSQKIRAMQLKNDTASIIGEVTNLINYLPSDPNAYLFAGQVYESIGIDSLQALAYYQQACKLDSTNGKAFIALAEYYSNINDTVGYEHEIYNALLSANLDVNTKVDLLQNMLRKNYEADDAGKNNALLYTIFDSLTIINPGEPRIHQLYGAFNYTEHNLPAAAEQYSYALNLDPQNDNYRIALAQLYMQTGDTASMLSCCREGIALSPDNLYFPITASSILAEQGKVSEAIALVDSITINEIKNPEGVSSFISHKADLYSRADSIDLAIKTYEQAIKIYPDNFLAYNNASYFMSSHNRDLDKALKYARYAVLSDLENPTYLDTYAWAYFKLKNYPEAKVYIDKALVALNLIPVYVSDLVDNTDTIGPPPDGFFPEGVNVVPDSAMVPQDTTIAAVDTDITTEATDDTTVTDETEEQGTPYSGTAEVLEHAGDIYFMYGDPDKAVEFWTRALNFAPDNELLQRKVKNKTYFYK